MKPLLILTLVACLVTDASAQAPTSLTLSQAREIALRNHPRITAAELKALAAKQKITEAQAVFFPTITANVTAAGVSDDNTRIAAGGLNNPAIFERNAEGLTVNQIITDFGRSANLAQSYKLHARAEQTNAVATREEVLFQVDNAYFMTLQAQSILHVAEKTVATRQLLVNQVSALASNKIKSDLDVSLASVALQEGELLRLKATNEVQAAFAYLSAVMAEDSTRHELIDETAAPTMADNVTDLIREALEKNPELAALRLERDAASKFERAERDLRYPVISAVGTAGVIPIHDSHLKSEYAAAGVNLSLPLFAGGAYSARYKEAQLQTKRASELLRNAENNVIRDTRIAWQNTEYALQRLDLTAKLLNTARQTFNLARARYNVGTTSMLELSQTDLNETAAEIAHTNAKYDLLIQMEKLHLQIGRM